MGKCDGEMLIIECFAGKLTFDGVFSMVQKPLFCFAMRRGFLSAESGWCTKASGYI